MPVAFLTDGQATAFGSFADEPMRPGLERFFFLDDEDRKLIAKRRGDHNRLGFALQMCTVRYIGLFLQDPLAVPWPVVEHLAAQLEIEDASQIKRYTERQMTAYGHAWERCMRRTATTRTRTTLRGGSSGRSWTAHAEGPKALFDHSVGWLRRNRVLLPGVSVLAREITEVRRIAEERLHATVAKEVRRADASPQPRPRRYRAPAGMGRWQVSCLYDV